MTPALPGDANLDGKVDINDLTMVLAHYGQSGMTWAQGEFTGDGTVDINDLTIVLAPAPGQSAGWPSAGGVCRRAGAGARSRLLTAGDGRPVRLRLAETKIRDNAAANCKGPFATLLCRRRGGPSSNNGNEGHEMFLRSEEYKTCLGLCALTRVFKFRSSGLALNCVLIAAGGFGAKPLVSRAITRQSWREWPTSIRPPRTQWGKVSVERDRDRVNRLGTQCVIPRWSGDVLCWTVGDAGGTMTPVQRGGQRVERLLETARQYAAAVSTRVLRLERNAGCQPAIRNSPRGIDFNGMGQNGLVASATKIGAQQSRSGMGLRPQYEHLLFLGPARTMAISANSSGYGGAGRDGSGNQGFIWNEAHPIPYNTIPSLNFAWGISQNSQLVAGENQSGQAAVYNTSSGTVSTYWGGEQPPTVNDSGLVVGDTRHRLLLLRRWHPGDGGNRRPAGRSM